MKEYAHSSHSNIKDLNQNVKKKVEKPRALEHRLADLEKHFNYYLLEEVMASLKSANKIELNNVRDKLMKLEMSLSFKLESEEL